MSTIGSPFASNRSRTRRMAASICREAAAVVASGVPSGNETVASIWLPSVSGKTIKGVVPEATKPKDIKASDIARAVTK